MRAKLSLLLLHIGDEHASVIRQAIGRQEVSSGCRDVKEARGRQMIAVKGLGYRWLTPGVQRRAPGNVAAIFVRWRWRWI